MLLKQALNAALQPKNHKKLILKIDQTVAIASLQYRPQ